VHLIVLTAFGFVKFSQAGPADKSGPAPLASISRIKKLTEGTLITPKPKMRKPAENRFTKAPKRLLKTEHIFDTAGPARYSRPVEDFLTGAQKPDASGPVSAGEIVLPERIEFFGSFTDQRKVCYLVDCSGSMKGVFSRVRRELTNSIQNLQLDQYFYIIFFGGDRLIEIGDGRMIRATRQAKDAAYGFIDSVRPAGKTNALAALEKAVQIRDSAEASPAVIYFLTDGFDLTTEDTHRFVQKVANLVRRFAPTTKINTIGFWTQGDDREMLETIAKQSGGEFVFITDSQ
jgi:hypothetical protein